MLAAWLVATALAAPREPEVRWSPLDPPPGPVNPWKPPERVPLPKAAVVADGVREAAWDAVPDAPPLLPLGQGPLPSTDRIRVARVGGSVVVLLPRAAVAARSLLVLDPTGTASRWWRVELGPDAVKALVCDAADLRLEHPFAMPQRVAPCVPEPAIRVAAGEAWVEVAFPPGLATSGRLLWSEAAAPGGSWSGDTLPAPDRGRPLDTGVLAGGVRAELDPVAGVVHVHLVAQRDAPRGAWRVALRSLGRQVEAASVTLPPGTPEVAVDLPWRPAPDGWLELRGADVDGLAASAVLRLSSLEPRVWLATPVVDGVVDGVVELRWSSPAPLRGLPIVLDDGRRTFRTTLDLAGPAGRIVITLPRGWRAPTVSAPPLLPPTRTSR